MKDILLKAKHWQLFLICFGIPIIFQLIFMGTLLFKMANNDELDLNILTLLFIIVPAIFILTIGVFIGWQWAVGNSLQQKLPIDLKMDTKWFNIALATLSVSLIIVFTIMIYLMSAVFKQSELTNMSFVILLLPIQILSAVSTIYSYYFLAKTIKTIEMKKTVKFGEFVGEFFMIWFFPIGVWILQPKINSIFHEEVEKL